MSKQKYEYEIHEVRITATCNIDNQKDILLVDIQDKAYDGWKVHTLTYRANYDATILFEREAEFWSLWTWGWLTLVEIGVF